MALETMTVVDTQHEDMIHDAQMDYYGRRLATASSDHQVKVFDVSDEGSYLVASLVGHEGPVWQVAWAHPKYGSVVASCSYDRRVILWKESGAQWTKLYEYSGHSASVNSVSFAPDDPLNLGGAEEGLLLASGSSDGSIAIISTTGDGTWSTETIAKAHHMGCNSVSWAPAVVPGSLVSAPAGGAGGSSRPVRRLVSGGCDNVAKIWRYDRETMKWVLETTLGDFHKDWVRDAAWAPSIGLPYSTIATCSQDGTVAIWMQDEDGGPWKSKLLSQFNEPVWRVSWSVAGNILAVASGEGKITLWKETLEGEWSSLGDVAQK